MKFCTFTLIDNSPDPIKQVIDKFGRYHAAFGHELSGIAIENAGLPEDLNHESVERFVGDVLPVLTSAYPSRVWNT